MVTPTVPFTITPSSWGAMMPLTIPTVPLWTTTPQPDIGLLPEQQQAYQEEQQAQVHDRQVDAERRAVQWRGELTGERAAIEA
jgi:hypothetical protein